MTPESFIADLVQRIPDLNNEIPENREFTLRLLFDKFLQSHDSELLQRWHNNPPPEEPLF